MSTRRERGWLDADQSGEDTEYGYDSDAEADSRGTALRARPSKRRRLSVYSDEESVGNEDENQNRTPSPPNALLSRANANAKATTSRDHADDSILPGDMSASPKLHKLPALATKRLEARRDKVKKTGVIYLTRIPPFMKPATVKHLLQPYGEIGRIFLTPEDSVTHTRRVKAGGNKKRSFIDGWVEFQSKKDAKIVADTLNATIIGGKKGGWYHDDVWNLKYLTGFKWHHLTEQIANENAERAARLRVEIAQTTRENKNFLQNVEQAKMLQGMEAKKNRKRKSLDLNALTPGEGDMDTSDPQRQANGKLVERDFKQNEVLLKGMRGMRKEDQSEDINRVLSKIF
ncbi:pre-rRNA-processing protein ESF2 [Viridothelium virens]|uniref:18S rRNA factor 2 n=1 Tax=Viridothelium virens TaxID=1048519 RepID=A0A6A6HPS6_VIRVR|nr:pre-rRNA-processing protein ESF2 [Viridothelium virens]